MQADDGVLTSLRRLAASLAGLVRTRAELFAVELQEEKLRAVTLLLWLGLGLALGVAGVLVVIGTLAHYLWQHAGYPGLAGLAGGTLAAAAVIFAGIRHRLIHGPRPFATTVGEFQKDAESLRRTE